MTKKLETVYKLTDAKSQTYNQTQWGEGVSHTAFGGDHYLCSEYWLHAYRHPLLAVLLNPAHGNFDSKTMQLWKGKAEVGKDTIDKIGCTYIKTIQQIAIPKITVLQKTAFAILVAQKVFKGKSAIWDKWTSDWLKNRNKARSPEAAAWAAKAAKAAKAAEAAWAAEARTAAEAAWAAWAADAAADAAAWAAEAAAWAAEAAAWAARAAKAARAAEAAAEAAEAARAAEAAEARTAAWAAAKAAKAARAARAAEAADRGAEETALGAITIYKDLLACAKKAVKDF